PLDRRIPHLRPGVGAHRRRPRAHHRGVQHLRLYRDLRESRLRPRLGRRHHRRRHHPHRRLGHVPGGRSPGECVAMTAQAIADGGPPVRIAGVLAPGGRAALFVLAALAIVLLFLGPIAILVVTSLRPGWAVYYIYRGTAFTLQNYLDVFARPAVVRAFVNSFILATLATVFSLGITVTSGYMLSRFDGPIPRTWFGTIYLFRTVPYISWVLPLYLVDYYFGVYDTFAGILLP